MLLFMILAMVSGKIHSLSIAELFTYEQIGRHKDFVGLVTALAIFIKIGAFSFGGGIATTVGVCGIVSGSGTAIASMGVASLAACGPAGWAVLGIAAVGAAATGAATVAAAKR